ncbi:hypothetical protein N9F68_00030 [Akkermansiaceae bacterium]|nr:hypothetical protein [Akkermansiaceae bacterium]MDB4494742.1 hypothetical protein [Akkermansiaceae bacterium]
MPLQLGQLCSRIIEKQKKDLSSADRYVATSRAKHLLTVVSIQN